MNEVQAAVASANVNLPTGTLYGKDRMFAVQATGQLYDAAAFRPVIVTYRNGSPVRLGELGRGIDSVQTDKVAAWFKDKRGIVLAIQRQPGTNTIEVVDAVKKQDWDPSIQSMAALPDAVKQLAVLEDDLGYPILTESVTAGEPDTLSGIPYFMSEFAPSTFTTVP